MQDKRWLPTMDDYYASIGYNLKIDTKNLSELKSLICSNLDVNPFVADLFVQIFFRELATLMLRGYFIAFCGLGKFFVSSPKTNGKPMIKFKFTPTRAIKNKLNGY
mgnify:CR=1 FL=1